MGRGLHGDSCRVITGAGVEEWARRRATLCMPLMID